MVKSTKKTNDLGRIKKQISNLKEEVDGVKVGLENNPKVCMTDMSIGSLRKNLSKMSDILSRFGEDLAIKDSRAMVADWDEIDGQIRSMQETLDKVEKSGVVDAELEVDEGQFGGDESDGDQVLDVKFGRRKMIRV